MVDGNFDALQFIIVRGNKERININFRIKSENNTVTALEKTTKSDQSIRTLGSCIGLYSTYIRTF